MRAYMKLCDNGGDTGTKIYIGKGILALFILVSFGCATVPGPPSSPFSSQQQNTERSLAQNPERRTQNADSVAALVALLESKNVLSADEAARFTHNVVSSTQNADSVTTLVALLEKKNVLTAEEAARFTEQPAVRVAGGEKGAAIVSETIDKEQIEKITADVTEELRKNIREQVKNEVSQELPVEMKKVEQAAAAPAWTQRIRFGGDIRLRYERDLFDKNNVPITTLTQGTDTRQQQNNFADTNNYKYRVRVGAEMDVNDQLEAVVRLSTGNTTNPVSTNSILGTYFNKDNVLFDLAYLRWKPSEFITMYGGRIPNPWFYSDLVWSRDLNFEGLALNVRKPLTESLTSFLTAGAFPLQQVNPISNLDSQHSKWLFGGQVGLEKENHKGIAGTIGAAYYDFQNITGVLNSNPETPGATDWSVPLFQQRGNTPFYIDHSNSLKEGLASEFREFNLTGNLDIGLWDPYHIVLLGDFVKNFGFNENDVAMRAGVSSNGGIAYQFGLSVGHPVVEDFGKWKAYLYYKYLEDDSVVDAFTDPDFHLGGTNARGWILGTDFGVMKNTWFRVRWLSSNQVGGPPQAIDVLQVDFNAKF